MFVDQYHPRGLSSTPDVTLDLYNKRHAGGSYRLNEEQDGYMSHRYDKARDLAYGPFVYEHHQQMYNDYRTFQDPRTPIPPWKDMQPLFHIPPPENPNFEENRLPNYPSATALIDNHYIDIRHQYGDHSGASGSG